MRATSRLADVSINTVKQVLIRAGQVSMAYHDRHVRNLTAQRVQCDELWSFVYAKQRRVARAKNPPPKAGSVWTWTAIDADSKLLISYWVGDRDASTAAQFMEDVASRLANRVQLTTDGFRAYLDAVRGAFRWNVDYAMLVKLYGPNRRYVGARRVPISGEPDLAHISTSFVERHNLNMRMGMRRFTRRTNGYSKKIERHVAMVALYTLYYNFCRIHQTLRMTPAMAAGIDSTLHDVAWIVDLMEAERPQPGYRGPYRRRRRPKRRHIERFILPWHRPSLIPTKPSPRAG